MERPMIQGELMTLEADDAFPLMLVTGQSADMDEAEAYRFLQVSPASSWETIEAARRRLVQHAHPERLLTYTPARRDAMIEHARSANAACLIIFRARLHA